MIRRMATGHLFYLAAFPLLCGLSVALRAEVLAADAERSVVAFMGPLPGTTYVYRYFSNGAPSEGQEGLVNGISREMERGIRQQVVARLAKGPAGTPVESTTEQVLRVSDRSLDVINSEGRAVMLLREPLSVGNTWTRAIWAWRPTSPERSSDGAWIKFTSKDGTWTALSATCRIDRTYSTKLFDKDRTVVVVSCSVKTPEGIEKTSVEEWASGLGMARAVESAKDPSGRDLGVTEQRLVRVQRYK